MSYPEFSILLPGLFHIMILLSIIDKINTAFVETQQKYRSPLMAHIQRITGIISTRLTIIHID